MSATIAYPRSGFLTSVEFISAVRHALADAGVEPGEQFVISSVPRVDEPRPGGARASDPSTSKRAALDVAPRTGSQRHALLVQFAIATAPLTPTGYVRGLTAEEAATAIGKPGAWRRVSELVAGGFIEPTGDERPNVSGSAAEVYRIADKGRVALRRAALPR